MELQRNDSKIPIALSKLSQTPLLKNLEQGKFKDAADLMPSTVKLAVGQPPICDIMRIIGKNKVVLFLKFELAKLSDRISVSGNMNAEQLEFISTQLVEMFPNESLADFKLCFERGAVGQYGEIFRMDGIVIRQWFEKYLDEKYQHVENHLMAEKENIYQKAEQVNIPPDADKLLSDYLEQLKPTNKIPTMDEETIRKYGKEKPERHSLTAGYTYFEVRGIQIYATSQQQAEELISGMIKRGELIG